LNVNKSKALSKPFMSNNAPVSFLRRAKESLYVELFFVHINYSGGVSDES
jgi:hypothetical protein